MGKGRPSVRVPATTAPDAGGGGVVAAVSTGAGVGAGAAGAAGDDDDGAVVGAGVIEATGAGLGGAALGLRIASITISGTLALESRITSEDERLKAVFELRIWLRMTAGATFASTIWTMLSLVSGWSAAGRAEGSGVATD